MISRLKSHQDCVEYLTRIITIINRKWKTTICVTSLATPRRDNLKYHTNGQIVNVLLKQQFSDEDHTTSVCLLDHLNLYFEGQPNSDLLKPDGYQLNLDKHDIMDYTCIYNLYMHIKYVTRKQYTVQTSPCNMLSMVIFFYFKFK